MKIRLLRALLAGFAASFAAAASWPLAAQTPPQFTVELTQVALPEAPGLHSFALGVDPLTGFWLVVAGRTNGLHTFGESIDNQPPPNAFPPEQANKSLWAIDPVSKLVRSAPLPAAFADTLSVSNPIYHQEGDMLYVAGGYGQRSGGAMQTFASLTAIPVHDTVLAVLNGTAPPIRSVDVWYDCVAASTDAESACVAGFSGSSLPLCSGANWQGCRCSPGPDWQQCMQQQEAYCDQQRQSALASCSAAVRSGDTANLPPPSNTGPYYVTVTGGGMEAVGDVTWVMLGQNFQGLYSVNPGDYGRYPVLQVYTQRMAALHIGTIGGQLAAGILDALQPEPGDSEWHRRDLNIEPAVDTDGSPMLASYGGVFVPGRIAAFQKPLYLKNGGDPQVATVTVDNYNQLFNLYHSATMKLWSTSQRQMQTVFFGGIGMYYISKGVLQMDTGLPFVNTLSVLSRSSAGATSEALATTPLPTFMGSDAVFVPRPGLGQYLPGILQLDGITGRTLAGWVYGGILSPQPQPATGTTVASNAIYEVWLTPGAPPQGFWQSFSAADVGVLKRR